MTEKTSYTVEVYDPTMNEWNHTSDPEENWTYASCADLPTFPEAQEAAKKFTGIYRSVRIKKHVWSEVALYQDGVTVG